MEQAGYLYVKTHEDRMVDGHMVREYHYVTIPIYEQLAWLR